jgi:hypothetical protein
MKEAVCRFCWEDAVRIASQRKRLFFLLLRGAGDLIFSLTSLAVLGQPSWGTIGGDFDSRRKEFA